MHGRSVKVNAVLNVVRQLCNTFLPLVTFAYATRVLHVENYGRINYISSIVTYFILIAGLGIRPYTVREAPAIRDNPEKIKIFVSQMFTINLLATLFSFLLLGGMLLFWDPGERYTAILVVYSSSILFTTLGIEWFFLLYEEYLYFTIRTIVVHAIQIVLVFLMVKSPEDTVTYTMIIVFTVSASQLLNLVIARRKVPFRLTRKMDLGMHLKPILLLFANLALVILYSNSDITMLGIIKGDVDVGIYKAAVNIYQAVKTLLNAVYVVTIPRLALYFRTHRMDDFSYLANSIIDTLITLLFPAITGLCLLSGRVVILLSGTEYVGSSVPLRILSFSLLFVTVGGFFTNAILIVCKKEKLVLCATLISGLLNILLNFAFIPLWGPVGAAWTTLIAEGVVAAVSVYYSKDIFSIHIKKKTLLSVLIGCAGIITVYFFVSMIGLKDTVETILIIGIAVFLYGMIQFIIRPEFMRSFLQKGKP